MTKIERLTLTRDNFIDAVFDAGARWSPASIRDRLGSPDSLDALFAFLVEFARSAGALDAQEENVSKRPGLGSAPLMLGRKIHLNLSKLGREDLQRALASAAALYACSAGSKIAAVVGGVGYTVHSMVDIVTRLEDRNGEVCVIEAMQERQLSSRDGATSKMVHHVLTDAPCRYPGIGCRFEQDKTCGLTSTSTEAVIESLQSKSVIEPITVLPPHEWRIRT